MKTNDTRKKLLGATLFGIFAAAPLALTAPAQAQPQADSPRYAQIFGRRDNDRRNRRNNDNRYDRDRYDRDRDYRTRYDRDRNNYRRNETFTGRVTNVRSNSSFDLRANGRIYNVYAVTRLPRRLDENDTVRVYGRRYGNNDIRNANVAVINNRNNRRNNNRRSNNRYGNNGGRYQSFVGIVTDVDNSREFDIRSGNTTYNVFTSSSTRRLSRNDRVRVYGQRVGNNDIRNANAVVTRNR